MSKKIKIDNPILVCLDREIAGELKSISAEHMKNSKENLTYNSTIKMLVESWREKK